MAKLKAGTRMRSAVGTTEVVLVAVPAKDLELTCGGAPMIGISEEPPAGLSISADASGGTQIGKRYVDASGALEVLCTKPGEGSLAADGAALTPRTAKALPSSD